MNRRDFCLGAMAAGLPLTVAFPVHSKEAIVAVDCHAHVFTRELKLAGERRYAPDYDAAIPDYLSMLAANGMSNGVLIQPSFLGTDNGYLLQALKAAPERLRGIAVVDPTISGAELQELDRLGVVGLRLNLIGLPDPELASPIWQRHLAEVAALGWQIEIQAEARRLPKLMPPLLASGVNLVIDHFGKPDKDLGVDDPGFRTLLSAGSTGKVWVKLSGAYRNGPNGQQIAVAAAPLLRDALGLDHLVWGSDWPHTQFEKAVTPVAARQALDAWLPDPKERQVVLAQAPRRLFRF